MIDSLPALLLTAGLGTRLLPLTLTRAKPAAPVAAVPLVTRILRWLASQGVEQIVLNLHHHPASITRVAGDGSDLGVRVRYSWEHPRVLGSAGGPRRALPLIARSRFFVINGDTLTDVALDSIASEHAASGADVTLTLVPNREPHKYGGVLVAPDGAVTGFVRRGEDVPSWHYVGIQIVEAEVFADLADDTPAESLAGIYRTMMADRPGSVRAWCLDVPFVDIGTSADYLQTNVEFARREGLTLPLIGAGCSIDPSARLEGCVLWDNVTIGADAILEQCVVADGVSIPAAARYQLRAIAPSSAAHGELPPGCWQEGELVIASM